MKRIGPILLFALLTLPFTGTYLWLNIEKAMVKKAVKRHLVEGLDDDKLVRLEFTHQEAKVKILWHHEEEFEFNGQLFDIVRQQITSSGVVYWCFPDHEETQLQKQLTELLNLNLKKDIQRQHKQQLSVTFYKNLFFETENIKVEPAESILTKPYTHFSIKFTNCLFSPPAPPPRLV